MQESPSRAVQMVDRADIARTIAAIRARAIAIPHTGLSEFDAPARFAVKVIDTIEQSLAQIPTQPAQGVLIGGACRHPDCHCYAPQAPQACQSSPMIRDAAKAAKAVIAELIEQTIENDRECQIEGRKA